MPDIQESVARDAVTPVFAVQRPQIGLSFSLDVTLLLGVSGRASTQNMAKTWHIFGIPAITELRPFAAFAAAMAARVVRFLGTGGQTRCPTMVCQPSPRYQFIRFAVVCSYAGLIDVCSLYQCVYKAVCVVTVADGHSVSPVALYCHF